MVVFVQVIGLDSRSKEEDEPESIFIHVEAAKKNTIDEVLGDDGDVELDVKITDGIESFRALLNREKIGKGQVENKNQDESEWYTLFLQALFQSIPIKSSGSIDFTGKKIRKDNGESSIELELKTKIGGTISKSLGVVNVDSFDPGEDFSYADCLFEWCKIISDTSKERQQARLVQEEKSLELIKQNEANAKFQKQLVDDSKRKDVFVLRVMTGLLNEKKEYFHKLMSGEIQEEADDFNVIAIKTIKDDLAKEEEKADRAKVKRYKRNPQTSKPVKKLNLKRQRAKEDEDGDVFISDSQEDDKVKKEEEEEDKEIKTEIKEEIKDEVPDEIKQDTSKAKSEESIHFKFQDDNGDGDNKDKQEAPKDDTEDDTEDDATDDDQNQEDQDNQDELTEEDNGTVTDTESDEA